MLQAALSVLRESIGKLSAMRYALALAGVAAAAAIMMLLLGGDFDRAVVVVSLMFALLVGMVLFARVAAMDGTAMQRPALFFLWSFALMFVLSGALSLSSVFFGAPLRWKLDGDNQPSRMLAPEVREQVDERRSDGKEDKSSIAKRCREVADQVFVGCVAGQCSDCKFENITVENCTVVFHDRVFEDYSTNKWIAECIKSGGPEKLSPPQDTATTL